MRWRSVRVSFRFVGELSGHAFIRRVWYLSGQSGDFRPATNYYSVKVSIITVVYNGAEFIRDCIESIVNQTYPDIEYIVIDGKSTDGTVDIVQ